MKKWLGFLLLISFLIWFGAIRSLDVVEETRVVIEPATSAPVIAELLAEKNVIRSAAIFRLYAVVTGIDEKLQAGTFVFVGNTSLKDVAKILTSGSNQYVVLTIPEGYNLKEIAALIDAQGYGTVTSFEQALNQDVYDYEFLPPLTTPNRLEGFLFPDTYKFNSGYSEVQIIDMMLARFEEIYQDDWQKRVQELPLNEYEIITLASIIEKEAKLERERSLIAGVFYNRLDIGQRLQSCATVQYALGETKSRLLWEDLEIDSPYNTYKNQGLPPGPICSPGASSLAAAFYPQETDYFYFKADPSGDGSHRFSTTFSEHVNGR